MSACYAASTENVWSSGCGWRKKRGAVTITTGEVRIVRDSFLQFVPTRREDINSLSTARTVRSADYYK